MENTSLDLPQYENYSDAEAKDRILEYCLERRGQLRVSHIKQNVLSIHYSDERILDLIKQIGQHTIEIAQISFTKPYLGIKYNEETKHFLDRGGFRAIENKAAEAQDKLDKAFDLEMKLAESNIKANERQDRVQKKQNRDRTILILVGIINLGVFIYQVFIKE